MLSFTACISKEKKHYMDVKLLQNLILQLKKIQSKMTKMTSGS